MPDILPLPAPGARWAFFLDVDGTLADIAPTPSAVAITDDTRDTLARLIAASGGALALVSGRAIADIDRLFAPLHLPAAGLHGLERRGADGHVTTAPRDGAALARIRAALDAFAANHPGTLVEDKGAALALHFRGAPDIAPEAEALVRQVAGRYGDGLALQRGKMVIELRPEGGDKGAAIRAFMAEAPFQGRVPVFVGDDVTDEDGFATINAMHGISIRVGDGRTTCAAHAGASVAAIHDWLAAAADALAGPATGPAAGEAP